MKGVVRVLAGARVVMGVVSVPYALYYFSKGKYPRALANLLYALYAAVATVDYLMESRSAERALGDSVEIPIVLERT